ncbi:hypothetical protein IM774_09160 [Erysipelotrichaceae bacterium RD49]|nr:hypothetical protein [Erysipelotrichaceae bacterium RD49]
MKSTGRANDLPFFIACSFGFVLFKEIWLYGINHGWVMIGKAAIWSCHYNASLNRELSSKDAFLLLSWLQLDRLVINID